jgi:2-keto-4-pentenoate hydratase
MTNTFTQAAQELLSRRVAGTKAPRIEESVRPTSLDDALSIQAAMVELYPEAVAGWKCLQPLAEDKFVVAPIFADGIQQGSQCELFADNGVVRIEPEIAFVLSRDLPAKDGGYSDAELDDAIGSCHMALELIQSRFADDSEAEFYERLADGLVNQGLYIGPEIDKTAAFAASNVAITATQGESVQTFDGTHPNTMPMKPVYWLINEMTQRGITFKAGEALITGSYCGIVEFKFDVPTSIVYQGIGEYTVEFVQKH